MSLFRVQKLSSYDDVYRNCFLMHTTTAKQFFRDSASSHKFCYVTVDTNSSNEIWPCQWQENIPKHCVAMGQIQRDELNLDVGAMIVVRNVNDVAAHPVVRNIWSLFLLTKLIV